MKAAIEKFITNNEHGLFLLDSPTGFGKTTAVLETLKDFLSGEKHQDIKRMFFVTNLKKNLPYHSLFEKLNDEEKKQVLIARSYEDSVKDNFRRADITDKEVIGSDEYKSLKECIDDWSYLTEQIDEYKKEGKLVDRLRKMRNNLSKRIVSCEYLFRRFVQKQCFRGKSIVEKKKFIKENEWFRRLYPISQIEDYKVIFLTTKKFFSPINVFYRMPFYTYGDSIIDNSIIFFDEFDATKKDVLDQIIEDGLVSKIDAIKLFKNIHYSLQNVVLPQSLLKVTEFNKGRIESGEWDSPAGIIEKNKDKFEEKYKLYDFEYLLKSFEFENKKAFLFDDGRHITVIKDSSKKHLITKLDNQESYNKILASTIRIEEKNINTILKEILHCIDYFAEGVRRLAKSYNYYKNTTKSGYSDRYNEEEAIMTVLEAFNMPEEFLEHLYKLVRQAKLDKNLPEGVECRRGFKFTEIEDSNYHDLQSLAHTFNYDTTPENLIVMLAQSARVVGISATASIKTVIGNYDLTYIEILLRGNFYLVSGEDYNRINEAFVKTQDVYKDKVKINVEILDNLGVFADSEKCKLLLEKIYTGDILAKYIKEVDTEENIYYHFQAIKLAYLYKMIGTNKIYSFIAFLNGFPKKGGDICTDKLDRMFADVAENNNFEKFKYSIISSGNFDTGMDKVYDDLKEGQKHFVITTYQTVGSGKNIQYEIPELIKENIVYDLGDTIYNTKDFDGVYLSTPTNLSQQLRFDSENKFKDIALFLFQQEYLYQNDLLSYGEMRYNIANGFKRLFFSDRYHINYNKNKDIYLHTAQYIIQAVGRLCRCKHKNKEIFIFSDLEIIERLNKVQGGLENRLLNTEFSKLLSQRIPTNNEQLLEELTKQNKAAYITLTDHARTVRASVQNISKWKNLRDYVLKNPTAASVYSDYKAWYFEFDSKQRGYSFSKNSSHAFTDFKFEKRLDMKQVSEQDCNLPIMLELLYVKELFEKEKYATSFKPEKFIMSESLYRQIYKGALGEVVGKAIVEKQCGIDLEEIEDQVYFEFFDYKYGNVYFDFKHWDEFVIDADKYVQKVQRKLNRVKGEKCIVINIVKRGAHVPRKNVADTVIQIPYLIDDETGDIDPTMIERIEEEI